MATKGTRAKRQAPSANRTASTGVVPAPPELQHSEANCRAHEMLARVGDKWSVPVRRDAPRDRAIADRLVGRPPAGGRCGARAIRPAGSPLGVDGALRLIEEGVLVNQNVDHFLCHYSSHHFRGKIADLLVMSGASIAGDRWFTNLYTRGNTGAASILIMLDEFLRDGRAAVGDKILCMVPESGRFNTAYMHFTAVGD